MTMAGSVSSTISKTTVVRGHVRGDGSVRVDGEVRGNVEVSGDVELGPGAIVAGNISAARLVIAGSVEGDLEGTESVLLDGSASVAGDLKAPRIGITEGAQIRGSINTGEGNASRSAASSVARPARPRPIESRSESRSTKAAEPAPRKKAEKRKPPPPVVRSPRKGAKGRKKSR